MQKIEIEFGPVARGIYSALLWLTILVAIFLLPLLPYYLAFLLFLAIGLKPFLIQTKLYHLFQGFLIAKDEYNNQALRKGYLKRNGVAVAKKERHLVEMKRKLQSKQQ